MTYKEIYNYVRGQDSFILKYPVPYFSPVTPSLGLVLAVCSAITPHKLRRPYWMLGNQTWADHMQAIPAIRSL